MAPESADLSLSDASPDDGSKDAFERSPPPSSSSDDGRERAPRARLLALGTRAVALTEPDLGGLARPRPRQPQHVSHKPAPSDHEQRDHEQRGRTQEQQPSGQRPRRATRAQAAQSVHARGFRRAPPRRP